jgi:hypothetical protein
MIEKQQHPERGGAAVWGWALIPANEVTCSSGQHDAQFLLSNLGDPSP